jgi:ABC-type Fe3+ transport system substrate-binding protein
VAALTGPGYAQVFDLADPDYVARIQQMVAQGRISEECAPTSAPEPDPAYSSIPEPSSELIETAKQEGSLVINSGIGDQTTVNAYQAAFEARFPEITMTIASGGSAALEQRFLADFSAGNQLVDAVITNRIEFAATAYDLGALEPLDQVIPGFFDAWTDDEAWIWDTPHGKTALGFYRPLGLAYNTERVTGDLIPTDFADLARPEFRGELLGVDPEFSLTFARTWQHIVNILDEDTVRAIGDNLITTPLYTDIQTAAQALGAGGGMVVMQMGTNVAETMKANGAPIEAVIPPVTSGQPYAYGGVATGAPHPNAGALFGYWLHSPEGLWVMSCAAYAGTLAYGQYGSTEFQYIENVSDEEVAHIKELLGL